MFIVFIVVVNAPALIQFKMLFFFLGRIYGHYDNNNNNVRAENEYRIRHT